MKAVTASACLLVVDDEATILELLSAANWPHHIFVNQDFQVVGANS